MELSGVVFDQAYEILPGIVLKIITALHQTLDLGVPKFQPSPSNMLLF